MNRLLIATFGLVIMQSAHASKTHVQVAMQGVRTLMTATSMVASDIGRAPTANEWPEILIAPVGAENWRGPYIKDIESDPWDRPYLYQPGVTGNNSFRIYSAGKNGIDERGLNDDISSWAQYNGDIYYPDAKRNRVIGIVSLIAILSGLFYGTKALVRWLRAKSNLTNSA
jgi:type II secretion system protein G